MTPTCDAIVAGAGPAGLATSRELSRAGVSHVVLERGTRVGETWANLYDSLVLHTAKGLSALPGLPFPRTTPRFPSRVDLIDYLDRYAATFDVPVRLRSEVASLRPDGDGWIARTTAGAEVRARAAVVATGIVANPITPEIAGRTDFQGRVMHSVEYRRASGFEGRRVLVVGAGNSAGEIAVELAAAGAHVTLAVRSGATILPLEVFGIPVQYFGLALNRLPRPVQRASAAMLGRISALVRGAAPLPPPSPDVACPRVPLIGLRLADALRANTIALKGGLMSFTRDGVRFDDGSEARFDDVILATGYRAALGFLDGLVQTDECGFARRRQLVTSSDQPGLYFVGHNYGISGSLYNIARDARLAARQVSAARGGTSRTSTETGRRRNGR